MSQDQSYFFMRANEERRLAATASNPIVRRVHLELAAEYALRAGKLAATPSEQKSKPNQRTA
jgi:hypothetical protein